MTFLLADLSYLLYSSTLLLYLLCHSPTLLLSLSPTLLLSYSPTLLLSTLPLSHSPTLLLAKRPTLQRVDLQIDRDHVDQPPYARGERSGDAVVTRLVRAGLWVRVGGWGWGSGSGSGWD
jgi:hypothetical protein